MTVPDIGAPELLIIALVVLLLFGASRLPKLGHSLGQSITGFKKGLNEAQAEDAAADEEKQPVLVAAEAKDEAEELPAKELTESHESV
jgi:sec-independent protein translocase protein TatA